RRECATNRNRAAVGTDTGELGTGEVRETATADVEAVQNQPAGGDDRRAGVGVGAGENERIETGLDETTAAADDVVDGEGNRSAARKRRGAEDAIAVERDRAGNDVGAVVIEQVRGLAI